MRVGVNRFLIDECQRGYKNVGVNFRCLFNLEPGAYHTEGVVQFNLGFPIKEYLSPSVSKSHLSLLPRA